MDEALSSETLSLISNIAGHIFDLQFIFAIIGFLITIPHLIITTRNSMRTSSTNSLIIGIALCDLIVLSAIISDRIQFFVNPADSCHNQSTYFKTIFRLITDISMETLAQTSQWIGLSLALIRVLVIKLMTKFSDKTRYLSETITGYLIGGAVLLINSLPTWNYYRGFQIMVSGNWKPGEDCLNFPENHTEPAFYEKRSGPSSLMDVSSYQRIRGISQLLVSVIYPILAIILLLEIRKAARKVVNLSQHRSMERTRTSRMILLLTLSFVISSTPPGITYFFQQSVPSNSILELIIGYGSVLWSVLFTINASAHAIICLTMSSEYRKTVRKVLRIREKESAPEANLFTSRGD